MLRCNTMILMPCIPYTWEFHDYFLRLCSEIVSIEKIITIPIGDVTCVHHFSSSGLSPLDHCCQRTQGTICLILLPWKKNKKRTSISNYCNYISVQLKNPPLESNAASDDQGAEGGNGQPALLWHRCPSLRVWDDWCTWLIQKYAIWYRFPFNSLGGIQAHGQ